MSRRATAKSRPSFLAPALSILIEGPLLVLSKGDNDGVNPNLIFCRRWKASARPQGNKSYERYFTLDENGLKYYNITARNTIVGSGRRMSSMMTKKLGGTILLDNKTTSVALTGRLGEFRIERENREDVLLRAHNDDTANKWILELQKVIGIDTDSGLVMGHDSSSSGSDDDEEEEDEFDETSITVDDDSDDDEEAKALFRENSSGQGWSRGSTVMTVPGLDGLVSTNSRKSMGAGSVVSRPSILGAMVSDFGDDDAANAEIDADDVEAHSEIKGYTELAEDRQQQEEEDGAYQRLMALAVGDTGGNPEAAEDLLSEWHELHGSYVEALSAKQQQ